MEGVADLKIAEGSDYFQGDLVFRVRINEFCSEQRLHVWDCGIGSYGRIECSALRNVLLCLFPEIGMHVHQKAVGAGQGRRQQYQWTLLPVFVFARKVRLHAGAPRQHVRRQPGTCKPGIFLAESRLRLSRNVCAFGGRSVGNNFGTSETIMRKIAMRFGPLIGNDDSRFRWRRLNAGKVEPGDNLFEFLKHDYRSVLFSIPGRKSELSFVWSTQVGNLVELRRRGVGVAPEEKSVCPGAEPGVEAGSKKFRDQIGIILSRGRSDLLHHHRTSSPSGKSSLEGRPVGAALGEQGVREKLRRIN